MIIARFNVKMWTQLLFIPMFFTIVASCQQNSVDTTSATPFFPQQREVPSVSMDALLVGKLILVKDCLRMQDSDNSNYLLIWPQGFSLNIEGESIQIKDNTGQFVVQVGDNVRVGGGEIPTEQIEHYVSQPLPNDCSGPYWIVASIAKIS